MRKKAMNALAENGAKYFCQFFKSGILVQVPFVTFTEHND